MGGSEPLVRLAWTRLDVIGGSPVGPDELTRLAAELDPKENDRAAALVTDTARRRFIVAHAWLRRELAAALDRAPKALEFVGEPGEKPQLANGARHFSLAHSEEIALLAHSACHPVGVDVELRAPRRELERVVGRFCTPEERASLAAVPEATRARALYEAWTYKEAYAKGTGQGLGLADLAGTTLWHAPGRSVHVAGWSVHPFGLAAAGAGPGYAAAVAVHGTRAHPAPGRALEPTNRPLYPG